MDKYIFSYILNRQENGDDNYILKNILFYNDENKRNKDFERIIHGKAINEQEKESIIYGDNKEKIGNSYLIDFNCENNENISNENQINENENFTNLKKNIHYSWILYRGRKVILDVQGVFSNKKYYLTDPAVQSVDQEFGGSDLGAMGLIKFILCLL